MAFEGEIFTNPQELTVLCYKVDFHSLFIPVITIVWNILSYSIPICYRDSLYE